MAAETPPDPGKPRWQRFLESTGGAALITVLLGGAFGSWITSALEEHRADNQRRYLTHQEYLKARLETIQPTLELVGTTVTAAEDLITLTRPDWEPSPTRYPDPKELEATLAKRRELREAYNDADAAWRKEKDSRGYLLAYYHAGAPAVFPSWSELETAVTAYVDCARRWYVEHARDFTEEAATACDEERAEVDAAMVALIDALGNAPPPQASGLD